MSLMGSCLCGQVTLSVNKEISSVFSCHCGMCRIWKGGPTLAFDCLATEIEGLDHSLIRTYVSSEWAERGFCQNCGTHLFYHLLDSDRYNLPAGLFSFKNQVNLTSEFYYDQKPSYYHFSEETQKLTEDEIIKLFSQ